jgi:signal transduction histidine kinase
MSNGIKFTPPNGVVTITLKSSQHGGGIVSDTPLTEEEIILEANEHARKAMEALQLHPDTLLPSGLEKDVTIDDSGGRSADEKGVSDEQKEEEGEETIVTADGRKYKKYGRVVVCFRDTGAGISKVA